MSLVAHVSMPMSLMVMVSFGVMDIGNVALVAIDMVLHSLQSAIGKMHMVASTGVLPVSLLVVPKLGPVVGVVDIIAILVVHRVMVVLAVAIAMIRICKGTSNH